MYDQNLVYWLKTELDGIVDSTIDKSKISSDDRFFHIFATKKAKIIRDYDFTELTIPKKYLTLTESQKDSIRELMSVWHDNIFFEDYLSLLCHIGAQFERANRPETKVLLENYQFLKSLWSNVYPDEFNQFEAEKRECIIEATKPQQLRPSCIECQSDSVISKGIMWHCISCGRSWLKNPRIHNRQIPS